MKKTLHGKRHLRAIARARRRQDIIELNIFASKISKVFEPMNRAIRSLGDQFKKMQEIISTGPLFHFSEVSKNEDGSFDRSFKV